MQFKTALIRRKLLLLIALAIANTCASTTVSYKKSQFVQFQEGSGLLINLPMTHVFSRITIDFESLVCQRPPRVDSQLEKQLCLDLGPADCNSKCKDGIAYDIKAATAFVSLYIVRAPAQCDPNGHTRLMCSHENTEDNRMIFSCPRELSNHILIKSQFPVLSVTTVRPKYPYSWVNQKWRQHAAAILKYMQDSVLLTNEGHYFELTGPDAFPALLAGLPKPVDAPPCHHNVLMAGRDQLATEGGGMSGRVLAMSTTQYYDRWSDKLIQGALAWLANSSSLQPEAVLDVSPADATRAADRTRQVYVWRVPNLSSSSEPEVERAVSTVATELGRRLTEGRSLLIFFGNQTRWQSAEKFLASLGFHFDTDNVVEPSNREVNLTNRIAARLPSVFKTMRIILTDMANNELHWDRNPTWITGGNILRRQCRDDRLLRTSDPAAFQDLLGRALCKNRDIVAFAPCTFRPACRDNTCGKEVVSGRPCYNKVPHFDFINVLLNLLTDRPSCLSQYDTAGIHPGPVPNLSGHLASYRVRLGKPAAARPLVWDPQLVAAGFAYGYGPRRELLSTGLYLPAMTKARVRIVGAVRPSGSRIELTVNHNLDTSAKKLIFGKRHCIARPWLDIDRTYAFDADGEVELFSPFGGLIHVAHHLPWSASNYDAAETSLELVFHRVVRAPYLDVNLVAASPSHAAEAASLATSPAPWGEFRSGFAILGAPRGGFARVDANTLAALRFIERAVRLSVLIGGPSQGHWRQREPQRIHTDVELHCYNIRCLGYSGQPFYMYTDTPLDRHNTDQPDNSLLDGASIRADRVPNSHIAFYHELGHNYSPTGQMFGSESEVSADFLLVVIRKRLQDLDQTNSPFAFNRYFNYNLPKDHPAMCQVARDWNWDRVPDGYHLADLLPALLILDHFGVDVWVTAQRKYLGHLVSEPLGVQQRVRAVTAVLSNVTGFNLSPVFAFFNYPTGPDFRTGQPSFDRLLAQQASLPAFFPRYAWVARCLPDRVLAIERQFGGRLVSSNMSSDVDTDLFDRDFFTEPSPHRFHLERLSVGNETAPAA